jgi:hypothetical protein
LKYERVAQGSKKIKAVPAFGRAILRTVSECFENVGRHPAAVKYSSSGTFAVD